MKKDGKFKKEHKSSKHQTGWYENYPMHGLVNANFGRRKGISEFGLSKTLEQPIVSAVGLRTYLTIPHNANSGYKQALNVMYASLRAANSGAINYTVTDLEKYVQHVRSLHAGYCSIRRAYAVLNNISLFDATTPKSYFVAMGLDYDTFASNAADVRVYGDRISNVIHNLCPLNIDLIERTRWLFSNGFKDEDTVKGTPYFFGVADCIYFNADMELQETTFSDYAVDSDSTGLAWSGLKRNMDNVMNAFTLNNKFQIIAGDMLKAFGEKSLYPTEVWSESTPLPIIYDESALTQIQNATLLIEDSNSEYGYDDEGFIKNGVIADWHFGDSDEITEEFVNSLFMPCRETQFINSYKDSISSGEVLSYTRLKTMCDINIDNGIIELTSKSHGTEVIEAAYLVCYVSTSNNMYHLHMFSICGVTDDRFVLQDYNTFYNLALASQMKYFPMFSYATVHDAEDVTVQQTIIRSCVFWDFNNYAKVTKEEIEQFHDYAIMSLMHTNRLINQKKLELVK